jgi:hypothetical protein
MRRFSLVIAIVAVAFSVGCLAAPWHPPAGVIYTNASGVNPSTIVEASDGVRAGKKSGEACAEGYLGFVSTGDMSLEAAKKSAGITRVDTLDYQTKSILLGLYARNCTVVTGE